MNPISDIKRTNVMNRTTILMLAGACSVAVLLRIVPLPLGYNFSALGALALFSGSAIKRPWLAMLLPLICRAITDTLLHVKTGYGFYESMAFDYLAYALICLVGRFISGRSAVSVVSGGIVSACLFFFVSNFGVWALASDHQYTRDFSGLILCLTKGLPFAKGTFAGDIVFSVAFFYLWNLLSQPAANPATVAESAHDPR